MASLGQRFDATEHDTEQRNFENLPLGDYRLEVSSSEVTATSNGQGTILKLVYEVIEPEEYKSRKIFGNINLENRNSQAQEIGQRQLASLCRAVGLQHIDDSEELHFIGFMANVGLTKERTVNGKTYPPRNEVKRFYFPDEGTLPEAKAAPTAPVAANDNRAAANDNAPPAAQAAEPRTNAGKARPWGNRKTA